MAGRWAGSSEVEIDRDVRIVELHRGLLAGEDRVAHRRDLQIQNPHRVGQFGDCLDPVELVTEGLGELREPLELHQRVLEVVAVRVNDGREHDPVDLVEEHEVGVHRAPVADLVAVGDAE